MREVGILTFHCADNYGGMLQAYGLKRYLTRKEIPFQHATLYEEGADRERRLYAEKLEQEHQCDERGERRQIA